MRPGILLIVLFITVPLGVTLASRADEGANLGDIEVSGTALHESRENVSAFTSVIKPAQHETEMHSLPEVLDATVGVNTTDLGGLGQLSTVSIRGSSAEQVAVFVDGVPINTAESGAVDFSSLPLDTIERIEVIRGGGTTRFGSNAIGGVVNMTTKHVQQRRTVDVRLTEGSFSTFKSIAAWAEPLQNGTFFLSHRHFSSAGDYSFRSAATNLAGVSRGGGQTFTRLHNESIDEDLLSKGTIQLTPRLTLDAANDFGWSNRHIPGTEEETTLLFPANPLEATDETFRNTTGLTLTAKEFGTKTLALECGATNLFSHDHFRDPSPALGNPIDVTFINDGVTSHAQLTHTLTTRAASLLSQLRYEYRFDIFDDESSEHRRHTHALAGETQIGLGGERILIVPGARVEDASGRVVRPSWKLGLVGRPWAMIDLKANAQISHRYPTFDELYFPDQGYLRGNPALHDERSLGWDAGVLFHGRAGFAELSYFQNRITDSILFVPISATTIQPINTGEAFVHGIEFATEVTPLRPVTISANDTWLDAHFVGNGNGLPGRPHHKLNARITGRYRAASAYTEVQYVGSYPVNVANTVRLSARTTLNLGSTIHFAKKFFATLEIKDVTDIQMYDVRGFPLPRRSFWVTIGAKA